MLMNRFLLLCGLVLVSLHVSALSANQASSMQHDQIAGKIEVEIDGQLRFFSALESHYEIDVLGDVVNVRLRQTFANPFDEPVHARYLFPLVADAAVHAMTMYVGNEVVEAQIQKKQQAQATFKAAKQAGKAASLLEQHRPNMFTQQIANLMPGSSIEVVIEYSHFAKKQDGQFQLVVPLVVGPRFMPSPAAPPVSDPSRDVALVADGVRDVGVQSQPALLDPHGDESSSREGEWTLRELPGYPPVAGLNVPKSIVDERVRLTLNLETPVPLQNVSSQTHAITTTHLSSTQVSLTFAKGAVLDNKDFVLSYGFAGTQTQAGAMTYWPSQQTDLVASDRQGLAEFSGGYFSLLIEPPSVVKPDQVLPREMVFVLDCSGSMAGLPMLASKKFMSGALQALRDTDTFRVIRFSDQATEFSSQPLPATQENIQRGLAYIAGLHGSGGTMMDSGIRQALSGSVPAGRVRNVVFLTDGYIGNEADILALIHAQMGDARLHAFGVGAGVNRYLLDELGRVGRGFTRYLDPTQTEEGLDRVVQDLVARLQSPVLQDVELDWGDLPVIEAYPKELPDLYAGETVRVFGRMRVAMDGEFKIRGRSRDARAELVGRIHWDGLDRAPLARSFARGAVSARMHELTTPAALRKPGREDNILINEITALGLQHALVTNWTSFVAVSRQVVNPDRLPGLDQDVALPQVAGVPRTAYGSSMTGYAAPEPSVWLSFFFGALGFAWLLRRRSFAPDTAVGAATACKRVAQSG